MAGVFGNVQESSYFRKENQEAMLRRLAKMTGQSQAELLTQPSSQAVTLSMSDVPTTVVNQRPEYVYNHVKGTYRPNQYAAVDRWKLGTQISMGRSRWEVEEGASIWSIADGKKLASTPSKAATHFEEMRARRIQAHAAETPLLRGYRLLPEFTPGRAMLWGTVLALWGTGAVFMTTAKQLDLTAENASEKLRSMFDKPVRKLEEMLAPLRGYLEVRDIRGEEPNELAKRLKISYGRT